MKTKCLEGSIKFSGGESEDFRIRRTKKFLQPQLKIGARSEADISASSSPEIIFFLRCAAIQDKSLALEWFEKFVLQRTIKGSDKRERYRTVLFMGFEVEEWNYFTINRWTKKENRYESTERGIKAVRGQLTEQYLWQTSQFTKFSKTAASFSGKAETGWPRANKDVKSPLETLCGIRTLISEG